MDEQLELDRAERFTEAILVECPQVLKAAREAPETEIEADLGGGYEIAVTVELPTISRRSRSPSISRPSKSQSTYRRFWLRFLPDAEGWAEVDANAEPIPTAHRAGVRVHRWAMTAQSKELADHRRQPDGYGEALVDPFRPGRPRRAKQPRLQCGLQTQPIALI